MTYSVLSLNATGTALFDIAFLSPLMFPRPCFFVVFARKKKATCPRSETGLGCETNADCATWFSFLTTEPGCCLWPECTCGPARFGAAKMTCSGDLVTIPVLTTENIQVPTPPPQPIVVPNRASESDDLFDIGGGVDDSDICLLYTSPSPRDGATSRMPSSA